MCASDSSVHQVFVKNSTGIHPYVRLYFLWFLLSKIKNIQMEFYTRVSSVQHHEQCGRNCRMFDVYMLNTMIACWSLSLSYNMISQFYHDNTVLHLDYSTGVLPMAIQVYKQTSKQTKLPVSEKLRKWGKRPKLLRYYGRTNFLLMKWSKRKKKLITGSPQHMELQTNQAQYETIVQLRWQRHEIVGGKE